MFFTKLSSLAEFSPERMGKSDAVRGEFLFAGLNAFEPGQEHATHAHAGQDKLYVILEGIAIVHVGDASETLHAGGAAFAPSGVLHSVRNPGPGRLVVLAVLAPPPKK
jgi:mannose-6-phosphate isomerase-like protein (cupin superfamily)